MIANSAFPAWFFALFFGWMVLGITSYGIGIWAFIDATKGSDRAFEMAGTTKTTWLVLIAVLTFMLGPVGLVASILYLTKTRPKVRAAEETLRAQGPWSTSPSVGSALPGWYADPRTPDSEWFWDGSRYTMSRPRSASDVPKE